MHASHTVGVYQIRAGSIIDTGGSSEQRSGSNTACSMQVAHTARQSAGSTIIRRTLSSRVSRGAALGCGGAVVSIANTFVLVVTAHRTIDNVGMETAAGVEFCSTCM